MKPKAIRKTKGFTLLEVIIAAAIFAFAALGIMQMFMKCSFLDLTTRNTGIAASHAETTMEAIMNYIKSNTLSSLQTQIGAGAWSWSSANTIGAQMGCAAAVYPCVLGSESIATTYSDADPTHNPPIVTVVVQWRDRPQANTRSLQLQTYMSKR